MAKDLRGIGPYAVPSRERVNGAALAAIARGGEVRNQPHRASRPDYDSDPKELRQLRKSKPPGTWTCACGQIGTLVTLPPGAFPPSASRTEKSRRPKDDLQLCIRCDAGHLMPNLAPTEEVI